MIAAESDRPSGPGPHDALDTVLQRLACPVCGEALARFERAVRCPAGHTFDLARQGYLPLLRGGARAGQGDTPEMVGARETFLARGHYGRISTAVGASVVRVLSAGPWEADQPARNAATPLITDLAGGTGHHLAKVLQHVPDAVGLDLELSAPALRRAARVHPRLAAVRADVWQPLPLRDGSCAVVLSIFGPRNPAEIARVLTPESGRLVVVAPGQEHLREIIRPLGMLSVAPDKAERLARQLTGFVADDELTVRYRADMTREDVRNEALMGPSAHHVNPSEVSRAVERLPEHVEVTVAVTVATYRLA